MKRADISFIYTDVIWLGADMDEKNYMPREEKKNGRLLPNFQPQNQIYSKTNDLDVINL